MEGLTDAKVIEIQLLMERLDIGILCLQETHRKRSDYYITARGYLLFLSGTDADNQAEHAGVGFLISPQLRRSVVGFTQATPRMASLKLRTKGGKVCIFTAYAPP